MLHEVPNKTAFYLIYPPLWQLQLQEGHERGPAPCQPFEGYEQNALLLEGGALLESEERPSLV